MRAGGLLNDSSDMMRSTGADKVIAEYPGITFAGELPGDWTPEQSQKAAAALLSRFPDTHGIIVQNDDTATGAIAAIRAEILTKDNIVAYIERYIDAPVETHFDATKISRVKRPEDWDPQYELIPSDIDEQWINQPKPEGYTYPEEYVKGREDGSYERIVQQFKAHSKIKLLDKSPLAG